MTGKYILFILVIIVLGLAIALWFSPFNLKHISMATPLDNSVPGITSDIQQHASASLGVTTSASSTSFWVTPDGYMAIVPDESALRSYIHAPQDIKSLISAAQELTSYASGRLEKAGYQPDPDNSSTSTDNGPFYLLRIAFVSSNGASRCLIEPPDPFQSQIQISWYFDCVNSQDIRSAVQNAMPFLDALGNLKGAAVTYDEQGNIAAVGVSEELLGLYHAILIKASGGWKVIYKGQGVPSCSLMRQYNVPESLYGQCS